MLERYLTALADNGYPDAADAIRTGGRDVIADVLRDIADSAQHDATAADIIRATCLVHAIDGVLLTAAGWRITTTPAGRTVLTCPVPVRPDADLTCNASRPGPIIGFPDHGPAVATPGRRRV